MESYSFKHVDFTYPEGEKKALLELAKKGVQAVSLAHLSADNNLPELAYNTVCGALFDAGIHVGEDISVTVARRDRVSDMIVLESEL